MNVLADTLNKRYEEVYPMEFYRAIFPPGELDDWREEPAKRRKHAYTGIIIEVTKEKRADGKTIVHRHTVTDDLDAVDAIIWGTNFSIMAPISYVGKSRISTNARIMYALVVELDDLLVDRQTGHQKGLEALINCWSERVHLIPKPTYVVASGNGLHLYYVFEKGLPLFPNVVKGLAKYKRRLTELIWNRHTTYSYTKDKIQQESIFQAFRMVGTTTKSGDKVRAFCVGEPVSIDYMNQFVAPRYQFEAVYRSNLTLAEAKEEYPEWYERKIVRKEGKKTWTCNRALYDWWKERILNEGVVGHRYYCMMCLAIYAIKCDIDYEELERDCLEIAEDFEERTTDPNNHFTMDDVYDALQCYNDSRLITYPINSIANRSGLEIEKNKRNYRKQAVHVEIMTRTRDVLYPNGSWREGNGRKSAEATVLEWRLANPDGTKYRCMKETGLSKPTVYKWWDALFKL